MFEISDLKSKKLPELQEIAKGLKVPKFKTLKKLDLVYQILDVQAANPKVAEAIASVPDLAQGKPTERPKRSRVSHAEKAEGKATDNTKTEAPSTAEKPVKKPQKEGNRPNPRAATGQSTKKDHQKGPQQHKTQSVKKSHHQKTDRTNAIAILTKISRTDIRNLNMNSTALLQVKGSSILCKMAMVF